MTAPDGVDNIEGVALTFDDVGEAMTSAPDIDALTIADYEEVFADYRRLTRELDVAMHGEEGAAKQASLCDLIEPAKVLRAALTSLQAAQAEIEKLKGDLAFADEQSAKVERLLEPHIQWDCATEGCVKAASTHFVRGGVGSYYCDACYLRIQAIPAADRGSE